MGISHTNAARFKDPIANHFQIAYELTKSTKSRGGRVWPLGSSSGIGFLVTTQKHISIVDGYMEECLDLQDPKEMYTEGL